MICATVFRFCGLLRSRALSLSHTLATFLTLALCQAPWLAKPLGRTSKFHFENCRSRDMIFLPFSALCSKNPIFGILLTQDSGERNLHIKWSLSTRELEAPFAQ